MSSQISNITRKRLIGELRLLNDDPLELIDTYPDEKDILTWYFLLRGPDFTDYKGGFYIGKVLLNPEYPTKPPDFMMLTPNGRFEIEKKICLTNSGYHSESWSALWNMKTILLGFLSIMADDSTIGISHIKRPASERKILAEASINYNLTYHYDKWVKFKRFVKSDGTPRSDEEIKALSIPTKKKRGARTETSKTEVSKAEMSKTETFKIENIKSDINSDIKTEAIKTDIVNIVDKQEKEVLAKSKSDNDNQNKLFDINTFNSKECVGIDISKIDKEYNKIVNLFKNEQIAG